MMSRLLKQQQALLPAPAHELAAQMAEAGYKVTQPRLAVLRAAVALDKAFTVHELEQWLLQRNESPGIASIFRTVKLLCDLELFQRIHGLEDCHRYSISGGHAHHLICVSCGALKSFDNCGLRDLITTLEQQTGYHINDHVLELFGRCPRCLAV
ncbi:Fur family transcriptional regulator [Candidatus Chloroploca mongolica]|nr:Fur family transcriptional regulator [Candidatus Chloroploca mongolica]